MKPLNFFEACVYYSFIGIFMLVVIGIFPWLLIGVPVAIVYSLCKPKPQLPIPKAKPKKKAQNKSGKRGK